MTPRRKTTVHVHERAYEQGVLAAVVAARRTELGLDQADLAGLADCSVRFVHNLEAGKRTVQLDKLLDVLAVLGLHLTLERGARGEGVVAGTQVADLYGLDHGLDSPGGTSS